MDFKANCEHDTLSSTQRDDSGTQASLMRRFMSVHLLICINVWGDNCSDVPASHLGSTSTYTPNAPARFSPTVPTTFVTRPCENCT